MSYLEQPIKHLITENDPKNFWWLRTKKFWDRLILF